jgi:hypothetical protein
LLGAFGITNYNKEDLSFVHQGPKIQIDLNRLANELLHLTGREKNPNAVMGANSQYHDSREAYTDRLQAINQVGMANTQIRSQTVLGQTAHFETANEASSAQNAKQNQAPSENTQDQNAHRLHPKRLKSAASQKQSRPGNNSSYSRQGSKHSKGF